MSADVSRDSTHELFVHEAGQRGAPTIVFLHGGGLSGRMWQPQLERLSEFHCLVPDLPEQGRSVAVGAFVLTDAVARVAELIRTRATNGRAHVVGLSLGGAVALTLLGRAPELVDHALVSGTAARMGPLLGAISRASGSVYAWLSQDLLIKAALGQFRIPAAYMADVRADLALSSNRAFADHVTAALMALELPRATTAPLLAVVGQRETLVAKQAARTIVAAVPNARGGVVPQVGHVWNLEAPDLFAELVRAWCTNRELPRALQPL